MKNVIFRWAVIFVIASLVLSACASQSVPATEVPIIIVPSAVPTDMPAPNVTLIPVQPEIPSLRETLADYFPVGAAIMSDQLYSGEHAYLLTRHFNSITPENEMKPLSIQPSEGNFTWRGADELVAFAKAYNMAVHGHTLVWHQQVPDWMFNDEQGKPLTASPESKALVLARLETHIRALVGRYKGAINVWDVVNEVIDPGYQDCMRRTKWYELTGTDYIATAFRVAREVDPDAKLLINDYGTTDPERRTCLYNVVSDLLAQGVPVDGVGHQMHINIETPTPYQIESTIQKFAELGVDQHITEMDMSLYTNDSSSYKQVPGEILIQQGHRYKDIFEVFRRQADNLQSVTFWGMADDHTWLKTWPIPRKNLPLLFDEDLQAKSAFWGIVDPSPENLRMLVQKVNVSQATPVLDAKAELMWSQQPWLEIPGTQKVTAQFQTRWDAEHVYLFVDVKGFAEDVSKIEVFIDENKNKTQTYEKDDRHYIFENGACVACEGVTFAESPEAGYRLEVALPFNLAAGRSGQKVGFDIRITEAGYAPVSWNDHTNGQDMDTSQFGTLTFTSASNMTTAVAGTPVIDAEEDAVWANATETATDIWVAGNSGATATVKTLWDSQYLYVYAVVTDTLLSDASRNAWEQDSFEVFIDQNNAKTTSYEADDGQFRVNFNNVQSYNGNAKVELITSATKIVPGGYVVELAIKFDAITPQEGMLIGFDFQVNNDENGDGVRDSISKWNDPTDNSYMNTARFGLLQFVK